MPGCQYLNSLPKPCTRKTGVDAEKERSQACAKETACPEQHGPAYLRAEDSAAFSTIDKVRLYETDEPPVVFFSFETERMLGTRTTIPPLIET